ncbi:MAG: amidohydrolase family protein [Betaproteobacteria bacterium]|nr:amidohydrolase family protein [Betaproteobacteria bacterium]
MTVARTSAYRRIATEEAFFTREVMQAYRALLAEPAFDDPGFRRLWGTFLSDRPRTVKLVERLIDLGEQRIADMDASGIDMQVLALTSPGVQAFDAPLARDLAQASNDQLAAAVRKYPDRFAGLAAIAVQDPAAAVKELERGVRTLGLKGAIINSHTRGEYLDDAKFWPILEAAEALGAPIYLHPNTPPRAMIEPFTGRGLDGAVFGFAVETALHMLRIIVSGALDRFPKLQFVLGHLGEGLPYWFFRLDFMHGRMVADKRFAGAQPLARKLSEYFTANITLTTSGMAWQPAIMFAHSVVGAERLMYAMDYPYQYVPEEVLVTDALPLSAADKKRFYQSNAEKVFSL